MTRQYEEAGPLYRRATVLRLGRRAWLLRICSSSVISSSLEYEEAAPLYKRSLFIDEKIYGADHPGVATDLSNWAWLLKRQVRVECFLRKFPRVHISR